MSPGVTYLPAYVGLYFATLLALICNSYLDIEYGAFGTEVFVWAVVLALTLTIGWSQRGIERSYGRLARNIVLVIGLFATVAIFLPIFRLPRAGVYVLAALQAANHCVTTTRQRFYLGLLVSLVMVMFATNHYLADWTMLFYLLPYLVAVVFTLVAEQISRRAQDVGVTGLGESIASGQGTAIASATIAILALASVLYAITPQVNWPYLKWRFGLPTPTSWGDRLLEGRPSPKPGTPFQKGHEAGGEREDGRGKTSNDGRDNGTGISGGGSTGSSAGSGIFPGIGRFLPQGLPSPSDMRQAAGREGMPKWQADAILRLAGVTESAGQAVSSAMRALSAALDAQSKRAERFVRNALDNFLLLLLVVALAGLALLLRRSRIGLRFRTWLDYLWLGYLGLHSPPPSGAVQYFRAVERLLSLRDVERVANSNTREFLAQVVARHPCLGRAFTELVLLYERSRFGADPVDRRVIGRMRDLYRQIHRKRGFDHT